MAASVRHAKLLLPWSPALFPSQNRCIQTTAALLKNKRAGSKKISRNRSIPLTYEEAQKPHHIGVTKAWNSWNSNNLDGEGRRADTHYEDMFIRKFIKGTFGVYTMSEVVIKRQFNLVRIILHANPIKEITFLIGYSEEMLSHYLKCPVKLEVHSLLHYTHKYFKFI